MEKIILNCNFADASTEFENFISYQNALRGFLSLNSCTIRDEEAIDKCIEDLKQNFKFSIYDMSSNDTKFINLSSESFNIYFRTNTLKQVSVKIYAINMDICEQLYKVCIKYEEMSKFTKDLYLFEYHIFGNDDISYKFSVYKPNENVKDYFYPYLDTNNLIDSFLRSKETVMVISGKSGIGKSKFSSLVIKYIKDNYDKYINDNDETASLSNIGYVNSSDTLLCDSFWMSLADEGVGLVIIDDLDDMLSSRENEIQTQNDVKRNAFLNKFLSFTDGIDTSNIKFIITTNQNYKEFDNALIRKGRMFDVLTFRDLSKDEALNIWKKENLDANEFPFNSDRVLQCDLDSEMYLKKNNITKNYTLDKDDVCIQPKEQIRRLGL